MLKKLLEKTTADKLCSRDPRTVIEISSSQSVPEAFQTLLDKDVLSAPVFEDDAGAHRYVGFIDMRDLVSWAVFLFDEQEAPTTDALDIINAAPRFFKQFAGGVNVKYLSRRNAFHAVGESSSLAEVAAVLRLGVKRVPVLNSQGRVCGIISQSTLNRFLFENTKALQGETSLPISSLTIGKAPVLTVRQQTTAIETFRLMDNKHISGVGVANEAGVVAANTTSRDLKLFVRKPSRGLLLLPISEFLERVRNDPCMACTACTAAAAAPSTSSWQVVTCRETDTLASAMGKIAVSNVHRIYVVNDAGVAIRVITLTDVMKYIA